MHTPGMKRFVTGVLGLVAMGSCLAELPLFVREATGARGAAPGVWHVTPRRVVWKTADGLEGVENLLKPGLGQSVLGRPKPVCVLKTGAAVVLDFGVELQGGIEVFTGIQADKTPVPVRVRFGESVNEVMVGIGEKGATNDHAIREEVVNLPWLGKRRIGNTGFRFVRLDLEQAKREVVIQEIRAVLEVRDLPYLGSFRCNDVRLNRIWDVGAWTVHLNMQEYLWDGIKRDRLVWVGDMHPEWRTIGAVFGPTGVVPKSLDLIAEITPQSEWMNGISSYSMWWVVIQEELWRTRGDREHLAKHETYVEALLEKLVGMVDDKGSEKLDGHRFLDWPSSANPEAVHAGLQALMVMTLEAGERLMTETGEKKLAAKCGATAKRMRNYVPGVNGSKQAAALLALAGLRDAEDVNTKVLKPGGSKGVSTFYGYYVLEAMALAGDVKGGQALIREYWGAMLDFGATSFWEDFNIEWVPGSAGITELVPEGKKDIHGDFGAYCYENFRHSLCHGWASGPTPWLSRHVLGVELVTPTAVRVNPVLGDLDWAEGTVPVNGGVVKVRVERGKDPVIVLPEGVTRVE